MSPQFTADLEDRRIIRQIAARGAKSYEAWTGNPVDAIDIEMSISAAHANGCALRLEALLNADDGNFGHDVFGICRYVDHETGEIDGSQFWPRYAQPQRQQVSP